MHFFKHKRGFTLVELSIVVILIGIAGAIAAASYRRAKLQHRADTFIQEMMSVRSAVMSYWETYRKWPWTTNKDAVLSHADFNALRPFLGTFKPNKTALGGEWKANIVPATPASSYIYVGGTGIVDIAPQVYKIAKEKLNNDAAFSEATGRYYLFSSAP